MDPTALRSHLEALLGARVVAIEPLGPDTGATAAAAAAAAVGSMTRGAATAKAAGYGAPVKVTLANGEVRRVVWRTARADDFGHDRRADRAAAIIGAYDDFGVTPRHVQAVDVGAVRADGALISLRDCGELYLITTFVDGAIYAEDLRRIAGGDVASELDLVRADGLAGYLAALHAEPGERGAPAYRRAIRDLIGHGEGIFGVIDGYPDGTPAAPRDRLRAIERRCVDWRWRLRDAGARLTRTHGDFHPFNIVFERGAAFTALDASRGAQGDPADDVIAMAVNYVFFALDRPDAWKRGLGPLWRRFWRAYRRDRDDPGLADAAPPFLAWRALVVGCPRFYPQLSARGRDGLLGFVERVLEAGRLDPAWAEDLFP